jgi:GNAT superfamily N-acetyltransferase
MPEEAAHPLRAPEPLSDANDLSRFDCGKPPLNDWLRSRASRSEGLSARTYVVCVGPVVIGYYTVTTGVVAHEVASAKLRQNMPDPIPAMLLARLAVDKAYQGRGIGGALLKDAFARILAASKLVGARAVLVHPIDQEAETFYAAYGFKPLPGEAKTWFLPIAMIAAAL